MKIQGSQHMLNTYKQAIKQPVGKKKQSDKDQVQISTTAKQMQIQQQQDLKRADYIKDLKAKIAANDYEVNYDKLAQKLMDAWQLDKHGE